MDILALNGQFSVGLMGDFKYEWTTRGLAVWSTKPDARAVMVQTNRGDFVEAVNEEGTVLSEGGDGEWYWLPVTKARTYLRFKTLPDPALTPARLNKERKSVRRYLLSDMPYTVGIPDGLADAIAWLQKQMKKIPTDCRASAQLDLSTSSSYGETYSNIEITYDEAESDEEVIARLQIDHERSRIREATERAKLDALKEKYEKA